MEPNTQDPEDPAPLSALEYRPPSGLKEFVPEDDRIDPSNSRAGDNALSLTFAQEVNRPSDAQPEEPMYQPAIGYPQGHGTNGWVVLLASVAMAAAALGISVAVWSMVPSRSTESRLPVKRAASGALVATRDDASTRAIATAASSATPPALRQNRPPLASPPPAVAGAKVAFAVGPATTTSTSPGPPPVAAAPPTVRPSPPPPPEPSRALPSTPAKTADRGAIDEVLDRYRRSFNALDPKGVAAVFQGANTSELQRTFAALRHQNVVFDRCEVRMTGADTAVGSCTGSISSVAISDPSLQRRPAGWVFALRRMAGQWQIMGVSNR